MDFGADVVSDEANDAFAICRRKTFTGIFEATLEPVDPKPTVGIEHHLDNGCILQDR